MAGDDLLSVSAFGPKHLILFSPTGDPSKPGAGTTHLFYGGACAHPEPRPAARTSPRRDEAVVPSEFFRSPLAHWINSTYTCCAWRSGVRLCRRATGRGI